jgi:hypothetical protein
MATLVSLSFVACNNDDEILDPNSGCLVSGNASFAKCGIGRFIYCWI